ncbi:Leucine-rich repeat serine/threonine-protein kinase 2 [Nowakowskiella sp. JEL0407]|nr:Leucine-rich repeat serine/threonine-protein kinase 2 [Nowakowskiella sp. JEL0407]
MVFIQITPPSSDESSDESNIGTFTPPAKSSPATKSFDISRKSLPVRRVKLVLLGQGRAGKTSLLRVLCGDRFRNDESSTVFVESSEVENVHNHQIEVEMNWKKHYGKVVSQLPRSMRAVFSDPPAIPISEMKKIDQFAQQHVAVKEPNEQAKREMIRLLDSDLVLCDRREEYTTTLSVYDFAGQSRYSAFQQIFVTMNAVYVVVFRLDLMFWKNRRNPDPAELQVVLSWLCSINLRSPESKIFLVGTHADKVGRFSLRGLQRAIPLKLLDQLVPTNDRKILYITSARTGFGVNELKLAINDTVRATVASEREKPLDWIMFQDSIAKMMENKTPSNESDGDLPLSRFTLSIEEVMEKGREFNIQNPEVLDEILKYWHEIGFVLYFPENELLKKVIFPNPSAIVNVVGALFRWNDNPNQTIGHRNSIAISELRRHHIWWNSLLNDVLSERIIEEEIPLFMELLNEFDLVCNLVYNGSHSEEMVSIIPCLLPDRWISQRDLLRGHADSELINIVLYFPLSVLPTGLYHQLAVRISSESPKGYSPVVYRRCARVGLVNTEVLIQEHLDLGLLLFRIRVNRSNIRADFLQAWMILASTVESVISTHWTHNAPNSVPSSDDWQKYTMVVACPNGCLPSVFKKFGLTRTKTRDSKRRLLHGIEKLPKINSEIPRNAVHCNHESHYPVRSSFSRQYEVNLESLHRYWFAEPKPVGPAVLPALPEPSLGDGRGTVMLSYSWGQQDSNGAYPTQEIVIKICASLQARGFKVWMDIQQGHMFGNMVEKMTTVISNCDAVIACVTNDYHTTRSTAYKEFMYACAMHKLIMGVKLTVDTNMLDGAYGFHMGYTHKFYDVGGCWPMEDSWNKKIDELAFDLRVQIERNSR